MKNLDLDTVLELYQAVKDKIRIRLNVTKSMKIDSNKDLLYRELTHKKSLLFKIIKEKQEHLDEVNEQYDKDIKNVMI
ncbi:hypothetical protein D3C71_1313100 [compost metagenome]